MSLDYVEQKIQEALVLSGGNAAKARRQIQAWFFEDPLLLLELTRPHWNGIVAYAVDRAQNRALRGETTVAPRKPKKAEAPQQSIGKDMLKSFVAQNTSKFGLESSGPPLARKTASQDHVDAIHLIAAKSRKKNKRT